MLKLLSDHNLLNNIETKYMPPFTWTLLCEDIVKEISILTSNLANSRIDRELVSSSTFTKLLNLAKIPSKHTSLQMCRGNPLILSHIYMCLGTTSGSHFWIDSNISPQNSLLLRVVLLHHLVHSRSEAPNYLPSIELV